MRFVTEQRYWMPSINVDPLLNREYQSRDHANNQQQYIRWNL